MAIQNDEYDFMNLHTCTDDQEILVNQYAAEILVSWKQSGYYDNLIAAGKSPREIDKLADERAQISVQCKVYQAPVSKFLDEYGGNILVGTASGIGGMLIGMLIGRAIWK